MLTPVPNIQLIFEWYKDINCARETRTSVITFILRVPATLCSTLNGLHGALLGWRIGLHIAGIAPHIKWVWYLEPQEDQIFLSSSPLQFTTFRYISTYKSDDHSLEVSLWNTLLKACWTKSKPYNMKGTRLLVTLCIGRVLLLMTLHLWVAYRYACAVCYRLVYNVC